ncbi:hypothetical protein SODALDRAFT_343992 [Sodiomyces alkalinus F11]|uniref:VPS37 C-terminal domain-containing protein n=1 Tax=Sodiomyces alkalinus (strain CBS 110278 / VKM F-3762 / F11) TaxID=1314773 RepID=A0A3N2Q064_SODAK|nr:hypothetical protein SODALDRAFT_343992 [Sodiomyces alkalinus F11]ROT40143.1 hypothetical protein SODALDRAFT_343992 [Sodiomyces alkalinus F11]
MNGLGPPVIPPKARRHDSSVIGTSTKKTATAVSASIESTLEVSACPPEAGQKGDYVSQIPSRGDGWLPNVVRDKSTQDLANVLAQPALLNALTESPGTIHESRFDSHLTLDAALTKNIELAAQLIELESKINHQRSSTQTQLLSTHAIERQWRQKQSNMDVVLGPFSPASLYQRLAQGVHEQAAVCSAMQESFIENSVVGSTALEREVVDWIRGYKDAKTLYYLRQERKNRWDEGRVAGWR